MTYPVSMNLSKRSFPLSTLTATLLGGGLFAAPMVSQSQVIIGADAVVQGLSTSTNWSTRSALFEGTLTINGVAITQTIADGGANVPGDGRGMHVGLNNQSNTMATLTIQNGGSLALRTQGSQSLVMFIGGGNGYYGPAAGVGYGTVNVIGPNSVITTQNVSITSVVTVGYSGYGALNVTQGGQVRIGTATTSALNIGGNVGSTSYVMLSDPDSLISAQTLRMGIWNANKGVMTIANSAKLQVNTITVGETLDTVEKLNIGGKVDLDGTVSPAVAPGLLTTSTSAFPTITFSNGPNNQSSINLNHTATSASPYVLGSVISGLGDNNQLNVYSGATVLTAANTYTGTTNVYAGELHAGRVGAFSANSNYVVSGTGILDTKGFQQTIKGLTSTGKVLVRGTAAANALTVTGNVNLSGNSVLQVTLNSGGTSPDINFTNTAANSVTLGGVLEVTGFSPTVQSPVRASDVVGAQYTLINSASAMLGDFNQVNLVGGGSVSVVLPDYLLGGGFASLSQDRKKYQLVNLDLAWNSNLVRSTGNFTLASGTAFDVDVPLNNKTGSFTSWDGQSLVKKGDGALTLSAANAYTGATTVDQGILKVTNTGALSSASSLIQVNAQGTLDITNAPQSTKNLSNAGQVLLKKTAASPALSLTAGAGSGVFTQSASGQLQVDISTNSTGAALTASSANLGGSLNVLGFDTSASTVNAASTSGLSSASNNYTLLSTTGGITNNFTQVRLNGQNLGVVSGLPDYLVGRTSAGVQGNNYVVSAQTGLAWTSGSSTYNGSFTLGSGQSFTVDNANVLSNQTATAAWDGRSLVKLGAGTLNLSAQQSYTGTTSIQAGVLATTSNNVLNQASNHLVGAQGTLAVNQVGQQVAALTNNGHTKVVTSGTGTALNVTGGLTNTGLLEIAASDTATTTLTVGGQFKQDSTGTLKVTAGAQPLITASTAVLDGQLEFTGFGGSVSNPNLIQRASELGATSQYTLIRTTGGITIAGGDFTGTSLVTPDYLVGGDGFLSNGGKDYVLSSGFSLAWTTNNLSKATGSFTVANNSSFNSDIVLSDRTGTFTSGWDGKTLTKSGAGTLVLSADNTYTGGTYHDQGILSIASGNNLGTGDLYLGNKNASGAAQLVFASSTGGAAVTTTGLNAGNSASISQNIFLGERLDNTIGVTNASHSVTLAGNLRNAPAGRAVTNTSGLVKTGAGTLIIDPATGNVVNYNGNIDVQGGTLQFGGDGSQITVNGDMQVSQTGAQLVFDIASNSMRVDGTVSTVTGAGPVVKSSSGTLLLTGSSQTAWNVTGGTLAVTDSMFNSPVTLASGSTLAFVHDPLSTPLTEATYNGLLTGVVGSQLQMNRSNSVLNLEYNSGSTIGDVSVLAGTLSFAQSDSQPPPSTNTVNRFTIAGGLTVANAATAIISGTDTYLKIGGMANFQTGSNFKVALDSLRPTTADVLANGVAIDPNATLEISGFAVPVGYDPVLDPSFSQVFKASDLPTFSYFAVDSESSILNEFSNASDGTILNTPSYIIGKIHYRADTNGNATTPAHSEIAFDDFHLAWLDNTRDGSGNLMYANGDFKMDPGTALNIDVALTDRSTEGGFTTSWDGSSLLKDGDGLLILSNSNNSYTGNTTINGGTLLTGADDVLENSAKVIVGTDGTLGLGNSTQHLQGLDVQGQVQGGNQQHDGSTNSKIVVDNGTVTVGGSGASIDIDHLELNNNSTLQVNSGGSAIAQITGSDNSTVDVKGGGNWVVTDNSKVGSVNLASGATVDLGDPDNQKGTPGRTLEVNNWDSNGGNLKLYGRVGSDDVLYKDQLLINGQGKGDTNLSFIDRGGVENRVKGGEEIVLVRPGTSGQIEDNAFTGTFVSGTQQFPIGRFTDGSFGLNVGGLNKGSTVPMYGHYDAVVGSLVRGSTAAVQSLSGLAELTTLDHCDTTQAFGRIRGASGDSTRGASSGKTSYNHVNLLTGSSLYTDDLGVGCLNLGVFAGYGDAKNDYYFANNYQGKHTIRSQQLGAYARYDANESWYLMATALHGWDRATINDISDIERRTDATTMALGVEAGWTIPLADDLRLTPSAQWIYQRTSIDGVETALYPTEFDSVGTNFIRIGGKLSYDYSESTEFNVQTNLWHQLDTETTIKPYANGVVLNPLTHKSSNTWGEMTLGVSSQIDRSLSLFGSIGMEGRGSSDNQGVSGRVGVLYRW